MPVSSPSPIRRVSQEEFDEIAFEVLRHVFDIHNQIGRFFDEAIYKRELEFRMPGVRVEEPIEVVFGAFRKRYLIDVFVHDGAIFEFKAVESIGRRHRAQLLHYLLLCDAQHGKLINIRPASVEHEFVNTHLTRSDRTRFEVCGARWDESTSFCH
jgi:GxxExxY protein